MAQQSACDRNDVNDPRHKWEKRNPVPDSKTTVVVQRVCSGCGISQSLRQAA